MALAWPGRAGEQFGRLRRIRRGGMRLKRFSILAAAFILAACVVPASGQATNVIFCIGDGMGLSQVEAAGLYLGTDLSFETFAYQGMVTTYSANSSVTDSAAAGTAMATGEKVNNGVISQAYPGDGADLTTLLEHYQAAGKSTGLVTTTYMTHATPAAFGAHEPSRNNTSQIAADYLTGSMPNVLFGGGANGMSVSAAQAAGYTVVTDAAGMAAVDTSAVDYISGQFGSTHLPYEADGNMGGLPHLSDMTTTALDILDNDSDGFFLMVEGGRIDHAGHDNNLARNVGETVEFSNMVAAVLTWAAGRDDTLVVVTADHETGGLTVLGDNGVGVLPTVSWSTTGHTGVDVPVYAWGLGADRFGGVMDNTDFFDAITVPEPATMMLLSSAGLALLRRRRAA
jgi:alkaline phosphatase